MTAKPCQKEDEEFRKAAEELALADVALRAATSGVMIVDGPDYEHIKSVRNRYEKAKAENLKKIAAFFKCQQANYRK
jgi:hypothetical protein